MFLLPPYYYDTIPYTIGPICNIIVCLPAHVTCAHGSVRGLSLRSRSFLVAVANNFCLIIIHHRQHFTPFS